MAVFSEFARDETTYKWSGFVLASLLPILQQNYNIDLLKKDLLLAQELSIELGSSILAISDEDNRLTAATFNSTELRAAFESFNAMTTPEAAEFMPEGIEFLKSGLQRIKPDDILILAIG